MSNPQPHDLLQGQTPDPGDLFITVPARVFDLDGTLRRSKSGKKFIQGIDDIELFPDVLPKFRELAAQGYYMAIASNQGGVAYGIRTVAQAIAEIDATTALFGVTEPIHDTYMCMTHPKGNTFPFNHGSLLRKPHYGMLVLIERSAWNQGVIIDWTNSLIVGDRPDDFYMAQAANVPFEWAWNYFDRTPPTDDEWNSLVGIKKWSNAGRPLCPECGENALHPLSTRAASEFADFKAHMQGYINDGMICMNCHYSIPRRTENKPPVTDNGKSEQ